MWRAKRMEDPAFAAKEKERYEKFKTDPAKVAKNLERSKRWRDNNKARFKQLQKNWKQQNPSYSTEYIKRRYASESAYALAYKIRARVYQAIQKGGASKTGSTEELVGCSFDYLRQHIERQFKGRMSWDNPSSFHIDHVVPLASFDLTDPAQLKVACNWQNLRPLPPAKNMSKGAKLTEPQMHLPISFSINT